MTRAAERASAGRPGPRARRQGGAVLPPRMTLAGRLRAHAARRGERVFLHELATGRRLTFRAFDALVDATCRYLASLGVGAGDRVAFSLDNGVECCLLYFACFRMAAVANPFPSIFAPAEIVEELDLVPPRVVLVPRERVTGFTACSSRHRVLPVDAAVTGGFLDSLGAFAGPWQDALPAAHTVACLYPSAGAETEPRGIRYTHGNLAGLLPSIVRGFRFAATDVHLVVLPLGHTAALSYSLFPAAWCGAAVVLTPGFWDIRDEFWRVAGDFRVTYVQTVPAILVMLQHLPGSPGAACTLPYVGCGSAPLPPHVQAGFERSFGLRVANLYGLSETGPTHVDDPREAGWTAGTIGLPLDVNEVRVLDGSGRRVPDGVEGELAIRGANVFPGYELNAGAAAGRFTGGFFRTGDAGVRDPRDGRFRFVRRLKPIIIRGGINIHPREIDRVLLSHPDVEAVSTTAVPDDYLGEAITSVVTLRNGAAATTATLRQHCRERLSTIKVPDVIRVTGRE